MERHETTDPKRVEALEKELQAAIEKADSFVVPDEYDEIVEENGGVGLNASTSEDSTNYFYSFPANRLELWFLLESERFLAPVFREFYKERDVVREERRMRTESNPQGQLVEALVVHRFRSASVQERCRRMGERYRELSPERGSAVLQTYYVPGNITIAIAGDVDPKEARRLADKYFARIPCWSAPSVRAHRRAAAEW